MRFLLSEGVKSNLKSFNEIPTFDPPLYFPAVLFIMLNKVDLTFEYVNEMLNCDHSNESY